MTDPLDPVRATLRQAEDVELPEGMTAPHPAPHDDDASEGDPFAGVERHFAPGVPPDEPDPPEKQCAVLPLNDVGNGRRFVIWFGDRLLFVGRLGFHVWDDRRWVLDAEISKGLPPRTRLLAQDLGPLIEKEVPWLQPSEAQAHLLLQLGRYRSDLKFLGGLEEQARGVDWDKETAQLGGWIAKCEKDLDGWFKSIARHLTHAKNAGNSNAMNNFAAEASVILRREVAEMDADAFAVNCLSGTLRLVVDPGGGGCSKSATVAMRPHNRADLITRMMPVEYDPTATCPKFEQFLTRIQPAPEMRAFLRRWFGYSMFGSTSEQAMCYFYGLGANGKSVLSDLMARIIGEYAATARIESLTGGERRGGGDATPDLMSLVGARMVRASEPDEGVRWNEGFIKEITGGEPMKVRALHSDFIDFNPEFKLTLSGNHEPDIRGTDDGIWRRLHIVPFTEQIPKAERRDMGELLADLMTEAPGILNWLITGAIDWAEGGLAAPEQVRVATQTLRDESDPVGEFLRDVCLATGNPDDWITRATVAEAFNFWRDTQGLSRWSGNTISKRIKPRLDAWCHPETGATFSGHKRVGDQGYRGLILKDLFARKFLNAPRDQKGKVIFKPGSEVSDGQE